MEKKCYRRGLVVGKFSPLHSGHEFLISEAQKQCEELIVISYSRPEFAGCSRAIRSHWLNDLAPDITTLVIDAATIEQWRIQSNWQLPMPNNSDQDDVQREFTTQLLKLRLTTTIDAVFTSEDYGEGFAKYLTDKGLGINNSVTHICVDKNRVNHPVSGTIIRSNFSCGNQYIREKVAKSCNVQSVCFLGGESTGKTTLSHSLSGHWSEPIVTEYGRTLWEQNNGTLDQSDLLNIAEKQTFTEDILRDKANRYLFCDTSPLTTLCYSQALFGSRPELLEAYSERPYNFVFLCAPDFPFTQDGTRKDQEFRLWQHEWYLHELAQREIPFVLLEGSISSRIDKINQHILHG